MNTITKLIESESLDELEVNMLIDKLKQCQKENKIKKFSTKI